MGSSESSQDRYVRDTLNPQLQQLQSQMPKLYEYFQQQRGDVLGSFKGFTPLSANTENINKYFDTANRNVTQNMNQQVSQAGQQAGASAAARGIANPTGYTGYQTNQVRQSFVPQFGEIEGQRFGKLADIQQQTDLYNNQGQNQSNQQYTNLLQQLAQMGGTAMQGDYGNQQGIFNAYQQMGQYYDPYSSKEKNTSLFTDLAKGGAQAASAYYGGQRPAGGG